LTLFVGGGGGSARFLATAQFAADELEHPEDGEPEEGDIIPFRDKVVLAKPRNFVEERPVVPLRTASSQETPSNRNVRVFWGNVCVIVCVCDSV
jgi:hypothetical protein